MKRKKTVIRRDESEMLRAERDEARAMAVDWHDLMSDLARIFNRGTAEQWETDHALISSWRLGHPASFADAKARLGHHEPFNDTLIIRNPGRKAHPPGSKARRPKKKQ